ncbi:Fasciclin domain family protein [Talaromyces stipitatus ATCC 10500]|uniref:Fasciclin domain family protein n=1 Tax=Talaromyces stipitatus (strain ATCC 10500 / CBS 375.48 / QM 6759 / NRRL 1006) TaxID=441959 RepID=B8MNX1_TALSN|nr:Fasciclin domain family protein [Talaromyces stipitatus ATCC 10500]XP_002486449.1 Fasciclin domain family protein [Talaromyces stipitatus ATCC 10500]EED14210.1 Fasciclin domain family protein [Talaromyces stipitatus ATCC 10500]EED14211.1 Fasciclin domain family protein [Talaromyces stipitatus ATCC 10500]
MKAAVILSTASLAAAFVIPGNDQQLLSALSQYADASSVVQESVSKLESSKESIGHYYFDSNDEYDNEHDGYLAGSAGNDGTLEKWYGLAELVDGLQKSVEQFEEIDLEWLERSDFEEKHFKGKHHKAKHGDDEVDAFDIPACGHHRPGGLLSKTMAQLKHLLGFPAPIFQNDGYHPHHPHHGGHHDHSDFTIYELISKSNHTHIFTHLINKYDDVVKLLNSTSGKKHTVFVPVDSAFKNIHHPHHNISKEAILHLLEYYISPEVFSAPDFFNVQTVPTLRQEETKSKFPQRISTSLTRKGLTLNFHSHVIRPDIYATNGIIHAIDNLLLPAFYSKTIVELVPSVFSTLDLALMKTGLIDEFDPSTPTIGGTFFAPTNDAFAKLPLEVNAFLFSPAGQKYLKALLKYHLIPGHTVFTDAYYKAKSDDDDDEEDSLVAKKHFDLPTYLDKKPISIDIRNFHRLALITVNKHTPVAVANVPVKEGVIHLVPSVLIPPHKHDHGASTTEGGYDGDHGISVDELMGRLEPYLE